MADAGDEKQICFVIRTNTFCNFEKHILRHGQIHFTIFHKYKKMKQMADRKDVTSNASDEKQTRDFLQSEKGTDQNPSL